MEKSTIKKTIAATEKNSMTVFLYSFSAIYCWAMPTRLYSVLVRNNAKSVDLTGQNENIQVNCANITARATDKLHTLLLARCSSSIDQSDWKIRKNEAQIPFIFVFNCFNLAFKGRIYKEVGKGQKCCAFLRFHNLTIFNFIIRFFR